MTRLTGLAMGLLTGCVGRTLPALDCDTRVTPIAFDEVSATGSSAEELAAEFGSTLAVEIAWSEDVVGWAEETFTVALAPDRASAEAFTSDDGCFPPSLRFELGATMSDGPLAGAIASEATIEGATPDDAHVGLYFRDLAVAEETFDLLAEHVGDDEAIESIRLGIYGDTDGNASLEVDTVRTDGSTETHIVQNGAWSR